jgi:hypothetical protein
MRRNKGKKEKTLKKKEKESLTFLLGIHGQNQNCN